jgi:hypothetical protein
MVEAYRMAALVYSVKARQWRSLDLELSQAAPHRTKDFYSADEGISQGNCSPLSPGGLAGARGEVGEGGRSARRREEMKRFNTPQHLIVGAEISLS